MSAPSSGQEGDGDDNDTLGRRPMHEEVANPPPYRDNVGNLDSPSTLDPITHHQEKQQQRAQKIIASRNDWLRPFYLGVGLFLVLFPFWLLDSLKDPLLSVLTNQGLEKHQPPAKLLSVCTTLALVCLLEYVAHDRQKEETDGRVRDAADVMDSGGVWNEMSMERQRLVKSMLSSNTTVQRTKTPERGVSSTIFASIGVPYCIFFGSLAYLLQFHPFYAAKVSSTESNNPDDRLLASSDSSFDSWYILGYILYSAIESYGSLSVAAFWSYANSTLSLSQAKGFYGPIIALAQLGAIGGSTMVTINVYDHVTLVVLACLIILLHIIVMHLYAQRFSPTNEQDLVNNTKASSEPRHEPKHLQELTWKGRQSTQERQVPWVSGIYLILRDNYVLLILGASCLYEVSLTCLHYQMTLLGHWNTQPNNDESNSDVVVDDGHDLSDMAFTRFMGRYGQLVNVSSLILSSVVFPFLMRHVGLRFTLRLFPTLLLLVNLIAFVALPGNLSVLVISLSFLKAMTYSIHDPSTEILYLPTAPAVKFQAKFWIDVVGARIAKAFGSSINTMAGSVHRSIRVASAPSLCTALALWWVCFRVGKEFDAKIDHQQESHQHNDEDGEYEREPLLPDEGEASEDEIVFDQPISPLTSQESSSPRFSPSAGVGLENHEPESEIV